MNITSSELERLKKLGATFKKTDKQSKYRSVKSVCSHGIKWDSNRERTHFYTALRPMEIAGVITELSRQVRFKFELNGVKICSYIADFTYKQDGKLVVVDVKSKYTSKLPVYRIKKKLMLAVHGIEVKEV